MFKICIALACVFAAASAGYLGSPLGYAAPAVSYAHAAPVVSYAHAAPVAYAQAPVVSYAPVVKHVVPAATSYQSVSQVSVKSPIAYHAAPIAYAAAPAYHAAPVAYHAAPAYHAPLAYAAPTYVKSAYAAPAYSYLH